MADDTPKATLARLKLASDALDKAQDASKIITNESVRSHHADEVATSVINGIHKPKRKAKRRT